MAKTQFPPGVPGNRLLARLPQADYQRLLPLLQPVPFPFKQILYQANAAIDFVYFPIRGVISALTVMEDGDAIEVANIGNEGVVGLTALFAAGISPNQVIVQVAGDGLRAESGAMRAEVDRSGALRNLLLLYHNAFLAQVSQSVACNGLHTVRQRCCRWLLMTHDRVGVDEMPLTHEFLAIMIGVRRASVTEVLGPFQDEGMVRSERGTITVLDRPRLEAACCECYRRVNEEHRRLLG